jgi:CubicO group peptidase (beta-lactamase class C family)
MWSRRQAFLSVGQASAWFVTLHAANSANPSPLASQLVADGLADLRSRNGLSEVFRSVWFRVEQPNRLPLTVAPVGASADAPVAIGSISKSVTGIGVALLIQRGQLRLDSNLKDLLSDYFLRRAKNLDPSLYPVTIRRLLTHTAGLRPNYTSDPVHGIHNEIVMPMVSNKHHFFDYLIAADAARSDGRETYVYSNISYLMLGLVIEAVSGQSYADFCQAEIFHKLGISSGSIPPHWEVLAPFSGWFLTLTDLLKVWNVFDINHASLLSRQTLNTLLLGKLAPPIGSGGGIYYCLGAYIEQNATATAYSLRHDGISNFNGLSPTYFMLIQKTVPGLAWAFATSPNVENRATRQAIQQDIVNLTGRLPS